MAVRMKGSSVSKILCFALIVFVAVPVAAQKKDKHSTKDTSIVKKTLTRYDSATLAHSPGKAALRSAILPGLGQIYNKKYWKLPIVYGGLGITGAIFARNLRLYRETRFAFRVKYNMRVYHTDSALASQIKPNLVPLGEESLKFYRGQFRRDIDYSALIFLLLWGLNVVDAAVDAHLKPFDVSPDLSIQFRPGHSEMAGTNGLSLVFRIGK
jgi:hypothetical protein